MNRIAVRLLCAWLIVAGVVAGCRRGDPAAPPATANPASTPSSPASSASPRTPAADSSASISESRRDLEADERCGGHTLSRHVGWTDAQLAQRLREQRDIAAASTYTDRATAETAIAAALTADAGRVRNWSARHGRRPNLVVRYRAPDDRPIGRSLVRGARAPVPCTEALVVLRWRTDLDDFCVLTSYPEVRR
jgi:hypothetical protein